MAALPWKTVKMFNFTSVNWPIITDHTRPINQRWNFVGHSITHPKDMDTRYNMPLRFQAIKNSKTGWIYYLWFTCINKRYNKRGKMEDWKGREWNGTWVSLPIDTLCLDISLRGFQRMVRISSTKPMHAQVTTHGPTVSTLYVIKSISFAHLYNWSSCVVVIWQNECKSPLGRWNVLSNKNFGIYNSHKIFP